MVRKTIVVQFTEGTTVIIPSIIWDIVKDDMQEMFDIVYDCIER